MKGSMTRPVRILLFSTLYPSEARPIHGIFVETRLRELVKSGQVEAKVVAPVPWFPSRSPRFGEYGAIAATPRVECRNGIDVHHPRYLLPPRIGMNIAPYSLAWSAMTTIRQVIDQGFHFDLIDAHYYYPDGVAAGMVARRIGKPFVVTARGTDLNLIPRFPFPRKLILDTAARASASIGVCKALMDALVELGADPDKTHVMRNGVDLQRFVPEQRAAARKRLGLPQDRRQVLSVGHLIERKGNHIAIGALPLLPQDIDLNIVGAGDERDALEALSAELAVASRVRFAGTIPQAELKWWYSAADMLLLCSSREGWANVLLESMACGTPVVATDIWGTPEVVSTSDAGLLVRERTPLAVASSVQALYAAYPPREGVRRHAESFSWERTTMDQLRLFRSILES
jgi:teichuronic acid biosynthesis glycosyltransferase TuaC